MHNMHCHQYLRAGPVVFDGCYNRRSVKEIVVCTCSQNKLEKLQVFQFFTGILHKYINIFSSNGSKAAGRHVGIL